LRDDDRHAGVPHLLLDRGAIVVHAKGRRRHGRNRSPLRGVLRSEEECASATHGVAHEIRAVLVDVEFLLHHREHVQHVLPAQLGKIGGRRRWWWLAGTAAAGDDRRPVPPTRLALARSPAPLRLSAQRTTPRWRGLSTNVSFASFPP